MKKALIIFLLTTAAAQAEQSRVSFIFMHRSVGLQALGNCIRPDGPRDIWMVLDTLQAYAGSDTARYVFHSLNLNSGVQGNCVSDTVTDGPCEVRWLNTCYDWAYRDREKIIIYGSALYSPILEEIFRNPGREDSLYWDVFTEHYLDYGGGNLRWEKYDMVMVKNPYIIWTDPTPERVQATKQNYLALRDTLANHPEINFCFVIGTPLCWESFDADSSQAKLIYGLATWFASDSFFTHDNNGPYRNLWKLDTYRPLCETSPDSANRYCLKRAYWAGPNGQSHLSPLGSEVMQDTLISFIKSSTLDILMQRGGGRPSRGDIDRKILDFREGRATMQEVLELIDRYNAGG
jgi:hypothetical protein